MKRLWPLGFLGLFGFLGIHYLTQGEWVYSLLVLCFGFFVFFLPALPKR
ncbi:MAG TPA: DUF3796 domain-containing protein [Chitinophagaceae bacterium]|nr:hypothetical protein [Chitinophagaceae bacterium]HNM34147.1 DUF3796 domain-containing protein [Chitinophagaceae bacterium]HNN32177.1 DUF3796 domain-containing protein [Chitinophagaceae bacterium]